MSKLLNTIPSILSGIIILVFVSCSSSYQPKSHLLPQPENTFSKDIEFQEKKEYVIDGIHCDNLFDAARLSNFEKINDSTFRAIILPENSPINESSYFAFRIWSEADKNIHLELHYPEYNHRYWPKLSYDKNNWFRVDSTRFDTLKGGDLGTLKLFLNDQKLFVSAQEIMDSKHTEEWCHQLARSSTQVNHKIIGKSKLNRDLHFLDIYEGSPEDKSCIAIFSRLHPPEVTGYMAMEHFVGELLNDSALSRSFRDKYRIMVYPLINPDGVDLGHWRHNAGGIDLNRDWAYYRQEEVFQVAHHLVSEVRKNDNKLLLGLDFHSTQEDVYYTLTDNRRSSIYNFKDLWVEAIDNNLPDYTPDDQPYDLNQPITKAWFYLEFDAEGITYEVGDETPRHFVREKAEVAAREMMKLMILRN